jgi:hypothetical protein
MLNESNGINVFPRNFLSEGAVEKHVFIMLNWQLRSEAEKEVFGKEIESWARNLGFA